MKPSETAIVFLQGFSESEGVLNGTTRLSIRADRELGEACSWLRVYYAREWKSDMSALIAQLYALKVERIIIVGYSWGFGRASIKLAKLAGEYGIEVPLMFSIDGVYRLPLPTWTGPNPFMIGSLFPNRQIVIPPNVGKVAGVMQKLTTPRGHRCVAAKGSTTVIEPFRQLFYGHTTIDDSEECHNLVINRIKQELAI